jgi:hypothetical protein
MEEEATCRSKKRTFLTLIVALGNDRTSGRLLGELMFCSFILAHVESKRKLFSHSLLPLATATQDSPSISLSSCSSFSAHILLYL